MMRKSYYQKVAVLGVLLFIALTFQQYTSREKENFPEIVFMPESHTPIPLSEFNPNELDHHQWQTLGFSQKQIATILNYKKIVGGQFVSKEQLKQCYAISAEKFSAIEPYLLLPETNKEGKIHRYKNDIKKSISVSAKFNPDKLSVNEWMQMGFSEKQALAIIKYRDYLGGSFISKEKFKECFIISNENYHQLAPYLLLPEKKHENERNFTRSIQSSRVKYQPFNPNSLDTGGWISLGFSEKQAQVIINYRDKNLKGRFKNMDDIKNCFVISQEKFEELQPYIKINTENRIEKPIATLQEKTDFSTIDLNSVTFRQLLEFGLDERSAGSLIGFRNKLGGFMHKQQVLDTYNIDKEKVQKLISTCKLDPSSVRRFTLTDAPEEWLKSHPYFKYSADKIIFYRISNPDDKKIWKLLKVKPEYEERMKWYLK